MNTPGFSPESLSTVNELLSDYYDFTRCVRPDGTAYGTGGRCRKGTETEGKIKGRVPKNDPKEPLAGGSTPLEKAERKLKRFEQKISNPDRTPTPKELEQYGKLKLAIDEFKNRKIGEKPGLFVRQDKSDLDESTKREVGKMIRTLFPNIKDREDISKAVQIQNRFISGDTRLKPINGASERELLDYLQKVSKYRARAESLVKRLPQNAPWQVRNRLNNAVQFLIKAERAYKRAYNAAVRLKVKV